MANSLTTNPLIIDTAGASVLLSKPFLVTGIFWDAGASAANGDVLTVKDKNGNVKFSQTLVTGNLVVPSGLELSEPLLFDGLIVSAMTHGTVYIYVSRTGSKPTS